MGFYKKLHVYLMGEDESTWMSQWLNNDGFTSAYFLTALAVYWLYCHLRQVQKDVKEEKFKQEMAEKFGSLTEKIGSLTEITASLAVQVASLIQNDRSLRDFQEIVLAVLSPLERNSVRRRMNNEEENFEPTLSSMESQAATNPTEGRSGANSQNSNSDGSSSSQGIC